MHHRRHVALVLFVTVTLLSVGQDPLYKRFTQRDGMGTNAVYVAVQDREGFIWFGTDAGAIRFDGTHFDVYGLEDGLSDEEVFVVETDSRGRVWFLTGNGRPSYLDSTGMHNGRTDSALALIHLRSGIRSFLEDGTGNLWFGGLRGEIAVLRPDSHSLLREIADPKSGIVGGHITFLAQPGKSVRVFSNDQPVDFGTRLMPPKGWPISGPNIIQFHKNGWLLHTQGQRINQWKGDGWVALLDTADIPGIGTFHNAFPFGEDELWVTLWNGGVIWLQRVDGHWQPVRGTMFQGDLINNVLRDREGNLWLSTAYGGVIMVPKGAISTAFYRGQRGRSEEFLRAHADDLTGEVWCGTNEGDVYRLGEKLELFDLPPEGPLFSKVTCIRTHGEATWVSTDRGVHRIDRRSVRPRSKEVLTISARGRFAPRSAGLKSFAIGKNGQVVGSMYGLFNWNREKDEFLFDEDPSIPQVRIYAPHLDRNGTLWFEEQGRLFSRSAAGVQEHQDVILGVGKRITDLSSIGDTLFLATNGEGIHVLVDGRPVGRIGEREGLHALHVHHLFVQGADLFVAGNDGAYRIQGPWTAPRVHRYAHGSYGDPRNVRDIVADSTHAFLLFSDGLCRIPRTGPAPARHPPVPYIRTVLVNDSVMHDRTIVGIHKGRDRLVVEFGAIQFNGPTEVTMAYRFDPAEDWQVVLGTSLELSNLPAGDHMLQVVAALNDGRWSTPVQLMVVVVPRLWERWWAILALVTAGVLLVFLGVRVVVARRLRAREERVRQRELLAHERQRIAMDLHDDLGAELSSMLLMTRMERERPAPGGLERLEQMAGHLTDKVKEVIWTTDPGLDTLEATLTFIQRQVIALCNRHGLRVRTNIPNALPRIEVPAGMRRELYLIAKEALNNTIKHSGATAFMFTATLEGGMLEMVLSDDGRGGAGTLEGNGGMGLKNMHNRAEDLGATLTIAEVRPHGTRVTLRVAVPGPHPNG